MKHIAVVGLKDTKQFRDWVVHKLNGSLKFTIGTSFALDESNQICYYCILCNEDMLGRVFNDVIECDPLRLALRLRLKNDEE